MSARSTPVSSPAGFEKILSSVEASRLAQEEQLQLLWHSRAVMVDRIARRILPIAYYACCILLLCCIRLPDPVPQPHVTYVVPRNYMFTRIHVTLRRPPLRRKARRENLVRERSRSARSDRSGGPRGESQSGD